VEADPTINGITLTSNPVNRETLFTALCQIDEAVFNCKVVAVFIIMINILPLITITRILDPYPDKFYFIPLKSPRESIDTISREPKVPKPDLSFSFRTPP
jgi:hypothetical protein